MSFSFNQRGFVKPYKKVESSVDELKHFFVEQYPESRTRQQIIDTYFTYVSEFKAIITPNFIHWLDGSFISKKTNPNDLDFACFVDYNIFKAKKSRIEALTKEFSPARLDIYVRPFYPAGHVLNLVTLEDMAYWHELFTHSRQDPLTGLQAPKGFIEIIY
jgi:hypothetical protein